jgi:hypothetical protein
MTKIAIMYRVVYKGITFYGVAKSGKVRVVSKERMLSACRGNEVDIVNCKVGKDGRIYRTDGKSIREREGSRR